MPADLFGEKGIVANDDTRRWQHLRHALMASDSDVVWAVRGGYGAMRLLPRLGRFERPAKRKLLVGFSDITALQMHLTERWGWSVLHGPMVGALGSQSLSARAKREVRRLVAATDRPSCVYAGLRPLNAPARVDRLVAGKLVGGNLKTLQSLLGTPWGRIGSQRILFVEDRGERGYAIDRMLVQMRLAGFFRGLRAMIFGSFDGGLEPDGRFTGDAVIADFARAAKFPVFRGLSVGHHDTTRSLPLGVRAELALGSRGRLVIPADWR